MDDNMKSLKQWVVWKKNGKTKLPIQPLTGQPASSTNPEHWTTYEKARSIAKGSSEYEGVGFVFNGNGYIGIDLDDCLEDPEKRVVVDELLDNLESYAEVSPSGDGVKVFGKGPDIGRGRRFVWRGVDVEIYSNSRFFTVTENVYRRESVNDIEDVVDAILHDANHNYYQPPPSGNDSAIGERPADWAEQVSRYLSGCRPAVEGEGGDKQTFSVACNLAVKFDLTFDELLSYLDEYNSRCDPPWQFYELEHKARYAMMEKSSSDSVGSGYTDRIQTNFEPPRVVDDTVGVPNSLYDVPPFMKAIVDATTDSNSRDSGGLSLATSIAVTAHAIGRRYVDDSGLFSNLYMVTLAPSAGGKQASIEMVKYLFDRTNHPDSVIGRVTSDSAIAKRLSKDPATMAIWDEFGLFLQKTNSGKSSTNSVQDVLLELWGATRNLWRAKSYADVDFDIQVVRPCFSFYGLTTPDHFWSGLTRMHLRDGFAGRLLYIDTGSRADRKQPRVDSQRLDNLARSVSALMEMHRGETEEINGRLFPKPRIVKTNEDAESVFESLTSYTDQFIDEVELGSIWGRAIEKAKKLALIYAVARDPRSPEIDGEAAEWAREFVLWSTGNFIAGTKREILSDGSESAEITREVMAAMKDQGHTTITTLVRSLLKPTSKVRDTLDMLEVAGMVQKARIKVDGKRKDVYCLK